MLNVGSDDPGGVFRTKGEGLTGLWSEGVHLLGNHVGFLSYPAGEQLRFLENWSADLAEGIALKSTPHRGFNVIPEFGFGRQEIPGPANSLQNAHRVDCYQNTGCALQEKHSQERASRPATGLRGSPVVSHISRKT